MSYSGSDAAKVAREELGKALATLQEDPNTPQDVMNVASNIAQAVGALFDAEKAGDEKEGKGAIRTALGSLSQTMALLQEVKVEHGGVQNATATIAGAMSQLHPLTAVPSIAPKAASIPPDAAATFTGERVPMEANIGATSETNFYVGFSGDVSEGGVFVATYNTLPAGTRVEVTITLPGGFEMALPGTVHFVRDPMDMLADSEPGVGVRFDELTGKNRELVVRFIAKRPPIFYDD